MNRTPSLTGWDIGAEAASEWAPWGGGDDARGKVLASAEGFYVALVEARAGYTGTEHVHADAEFLFVINGSLRNQGRMMRPGDAYGASIGSEHTDFHVPAGARYLSIFKL